MTHRAILPGSIVQPALGEHRRPDNGLSFAIEAITLSNIPLCYIDPDSRDLDGWHELEEKCPEVLAECDPETGITLAEHLDLYRVRLAAMRVRLAIGARQVAQTDRTLYGLQEPSP